MPLNRSRILKFLFSISVDDICSQLLTIRDILSMNQRQENSSNWMTRFVSVIFVYSVSIIKLPGFDLAWSKKDRKCITDFQKFKTRKKPNHQFPKRIFMRWKLKSSSSICSFICAFNVLLTILEESIKHFRNCKLKWSLLPLSPFCLMSSVNSCWVGMFIFCANRFKTAWKCRKIKWIKKARNFSSGFTVLLTSGITKRI